ncbi:MAG: isopeptide-forming domain-containing fimbrial protein [Clostridiales bacterium]|nr:isopeptide-forming domain-containing fimbrial protein [Clostridiales bacterium]
MTTMKKLVSLVLAVLMLCISAAALATEAETPYTITINGDDGHTYEAYQIFGGDLSGDVLSNIVWGNGVNGEAVQTKTEKASAQEVADLLTSDNLDEYMAIFEENLLASGVKTSTGVAGEDGTTYTIEGLEPGYYLIKDADGSVPVGHAYTKFMAKVVKNVTASPKTDNTTHEKKVYENVKPVTNGKTGAAGNKYNDVADYCIGDTVPFALYSTVPDTTHYDHYVMIFHDVMEAGLEFDPASIKVTIGGNEYTNITLVQPGTDGCTFELKLNELKGYTAGEEIRVDFNATLTDEAVIGLDGNPNKSKLEFSNNPNNDGTVDENGEYIDDGDTTETPWDHVVVFTYELDVTKVDGADTAKKLQGAEFVLQNAAGKYVTVDASGIVTGWVEAKEQASKLTSDADGFFKVVGLDDGEYKLEETKAPEGYNLLADPIAIKVSATTINDQNYTGTPSAALTALNIEVGGSTAAGDTATGVVSTTVNNNVGATLPETGGIGTTIFYVVGGVLVLAAIVLLVTKRRVGEEN